MAIPNYAELGRFRVHYLDNERDDVEVRLTSKAVVEAERRWPGVATDGSDRYRPNEGVHYMVWISLGCPNDDFDAWLDEGFVLEIVEEAQPDPTPPAPGAGSSPISPRPRASRNGTSRTARSKTSTRS
jgi:hypothetical protein